MAAESSQRSLTDRQRQVLNWVKSFIRQNAMPPTVREIGSAFGIKSSSVFQFLQILERKGYVKRGNRGARSLHVEGLGRHEKCACIEVPVVGKIAAGRPIEAIEDHEGTVAVRKDLIRATEAFALKVAGESMIEAGILDGDYVVVRRQETAQDGDIVVALIDGDATLKFFHREGDGVRLEPANRSIAPIHVTAGGFRIQGKVVGVMRLMAGSERK